MPGHPPSPLIAGADPSRGLDLLLVNAPLRALILGEAETRAARLLDDHRQAAGISYRLADGGEDQGQLVAVFDEGRSALLADVLGRALPDMAARVRHAVALFRRRGATGEDKRSALITLAGILEERGQLIKEELVTAGEGALFHIANKFAIRHQNRQQLSGYDPAFLDWVFWWYLGTVELRTPQEAQGCNKHSRW